MADSAMTEATATSADAALKTRLHRKSGADLRKQQLIDIASELICSEGIEAVKHSTLAELAGCTRALVYHYFPKKSDIFIAISEDFYAEFDELLSVDEQMRFVRVNRLDPDSMHRFFSVLFDIIDHRSMAACVLYTIPVLSMDLRLYDSEMKQRYQHRWLSGLEEAGILGMDAELLMANCMSIVTNVCYRYVRGDIARDRAVNQVCQMVAANVVAAHHSTKS